MRAGSSLLLLLAGATGFACASVPESRRAADPASWPPGPRAALDLTRDLLSIDTSTPLGRERALARLTRALDDEGIRAERTPGALVARVGPETTPAVMLFAHVDAWPVEPTAWPEGRGPFSAALRGGALWGRGVLGGKGAAALFTAALRELALEEDPLAGAVWLVVTSSGLDPTSPGLARVLATYPELNRAALALGPGGYIVRRAGMAPLAVIGAGERGYAILTLTAAGPRAPVILSAALGDIDAALPRPAVGPAALRYLRDLAPATPWPERWVMGVPALARAVYASPLADAPHTRSLVSTEARFGFPDHPAGATYERDVRARAWMQAFLQEGEEPAAFRARLRAKLDRRVHVDLLEGEPRLEGEPLPLERLGRAFPDTPWARSLGEPSQARLLLRIGVPTAGFVPVEVGPEALRRRGGPGERIGLDGLCAGALALPRALRVLSSTAAPEALPRSSCRSLPESGTGPNR